AFLSALISCSKLPVEEVGGAERDHVVVSRSAAWAVYVTKSGRPGSNRRRPAGKLSRSLWGKHYDTNREDRPLLQPSSRLTHETSIMDWAEDAAEETAQRMTRLPSRLEDLCPVVCQVGKMVGVKRPDARTHR